MEHVHLENHVLFPRALGGETMTRSSLAIDRRYQALLIATLIATFTLLGFMGREIYRQAPPIPDRVVTESGQTVFTRDDIPNGQLVWQSTGGQQLGSIWGTAPTRRRTGARIGCTVSRSRCSTSGRDSTARGLHGSR